MLYLPEELKKVMSSTPAAAFANIVLPVPGGPYNKTPFHGSRMPVKNSGTNNGKDTASFNNRFAFSRPAMSVIKIEKIDVKMKKVNL